LIGLIGLIGFQKRGLEVLNGDSDSIRGFGLLEGSSYPLQPDISIYKERFLP
jgi:hypothetical protein